MTGAVARASAAFLQTSTKPRLAQSALVTDAEKRSVSFLQWDVIAEHCVADPSGPVPIARRTVLLVIVAHIATRVRHTGDAVDWAAWLIAALVVWFIVSAFIGLAAGKVFAQGTRET